MHADRLVPYAGNAKASPLARRFAGPYSAVTSSMSPLSRGGRFTMLRIAVERPDQPEVMELLRASDAYMAQLYPAQSNHLLDVTALLAPGVTFLVARVDGVACGCAALVATGDSIAELKRMYVSPSVRGRRIGRRLLESLQQFAAERGLHCLRLETGIHQPEALSLYRSCGFAERDPFPPYGADPLSVFMEKGSR